MHNDPVGHVDLWGLEGFNFSSPFHENMHIGLQKFETVVTVNVIRETDGYDNEFSALRTITVKNDELNLNTVYQDFIGANAGSSELANKYDGMTLPDGIYYLTGNAPNLTLQSNGNYNSPSYNNVLKLKTVDPNIPSDIRNEINGDSYFLHANQKGGASEPYSPKPQGAGCNIAQGQFNQDQAMDLLHLASVPEAIEYTIVSLSNISDKKKQEATICE